MHAHLGQMERPDSLQHVRGDHRVKPYDETLLNDEQFAVIEAREWRKRRLVNSELVEVVLPEAVALL